jgi:hypothetical protein
MDGTIGGSFFKQKKLRRFIKIAVFGEFLGRGGGEGVTARGY